MTSKAYRVIAPRDTHFYVLLTAARAYPHCPPRQSHGSETTQHMDLLASSATVARREERGPNVDVVLVDLVDLVDLKVGKALTIGRVRAPCLRTRD